jgi:Putative zinc-finger
MKTQGTHAHEDRLLDFAYGELPPTEAQLVEQHVHGCSRCSEALDGIRGVRTSMSRLPLESAPDAGLESLLAYAQQSARRAAAGPEPAPRWWRRLLAPALSVAALSVFGVVVVQVNREVDLSPSLAQHKEAPREQTPPRAEKSVMADASAAPATPAPASAPVAADVGKAHAQLDEEMRAAMPLKPMPSKAPSKKGVRSVMGEDWSNAGAGSAGGFPDKKVAQYSDDEASALDGLSTKESKRKRDVMGGGSMPSTSTVQPSKPAPEALVAEAEPAAEYASPAAPQGVQYAPPEPKQTPRGSASRTASVASKDSAEEDAYEQQQQAPGRAQVASAAPPPPPPAPAQYQPSAASAGPVAQAEGVEAQKNEAAPKPAERAAARRSPSIPELMNQAEVANRSGDWAQEVSFLRAALGAGVQGSQRLEVLSRLCDAEFALGRQQTAIEVCKRVVAEAPGSSAARSAQRRLDRELQSPADEADSDSKASYPAKK